MKKEKKVVYSEPASYFPKKVLKAVDKELAANKKAESKQAKKTAKKK